MYLFSLVTSFLTGLTLVGLVLGQDKSLVSVKDAFDDVKVGVPDSDSLSFAGSDHSNDYDNPASIRLEHKVQPKGFAGSQPATGVG
jgi:hypothetical protein